MQEVSEREDHDSQRTDTEHLHLGDLVDRPVHECAPYRQHRVPDKERREENHEILELDADRRTRYGDDTAKQEGRNGGDDESLRDKGEDRILALGGIALEEPAQCDVAAVECGQDAGPEEDQIGSEEPRVPGAGEDASEKGFGVGITGQPSVDHRDEAPFHGPESQHAVEKQDGAEKKSPDSVGECDGCIFPTHLDGPLPLLEVEPRPDQETDADRHHVAPEAHVMGGKQARAVESAQIRSAEFQNDDDHAQQDEREESGVAVLDPPDGELLTEENACSEDHEASQGKVENVRFESQWLPGVAD